MVSQNQKYIIVGIVFLFVGLTFGAVIFGTQNTAPSTQAGTPQVVTTPQAVATPAPRSYDDLSNYWNWTAGDVSSIGTYTANQGYNYEIVTLHINNTGTRTISTNPYFWKFTYDGITYDPDVATFSEYINSKTVDVGPGGDIELEIAYLVKSRMKQITAALSYVGPY